MLNPKISTSKKHQKKQSSPRSPLKLKDVNVTSCSSSFSSTSTSTTTSISSEAPKGCLRFFHSNHSSIVSKNASNTKLKSAKTPKSAPNVRSFKGNVVKKRSNLVNPDSFPAGLVKNNVPAPHPGKLVGKFSERCDLSRNVKKPNSRYDLCDRISKNPSGFEVKSSDNAENLRKPSSRYDLSDGISKKSSGFEVKISDNPASLRKPSSRYDLSDNISKFSSEFDVNLSNSTEDFTPANKSGFRSGLVDLNRNNKAVKLVENVANCGDGSRSPTPPPVQSSVSPEIQGGLTSVVTMTPATCYAAGHVLSGVTDKRKCRPKGILTIGNNNLFGSSKTKCFDNEGESVVGEVNNRRDSIVPSPTEASVCWLSSPCGEKRSEARDTDDGNSTNELRLDRCEKLLPFKLVGCSSSSSPLSSLGFSSEIFHKSNCTISTSGASSATPSSSSSSSSSRSNCSVLKSDMSSEFRGVLGPSLDYLVRSPTPPSPVITPTLNAEYSPEQSKSRYDHERQANPDLEDSLGSGNVMQTPESNSSMSNFMLSRQSPNYSSKSPNFDLSELSNYQISRLWSECELDSTAEVLCRLSVSPDCQISQLDSPRPSFEFNPLVKLDSSIDLTFSQKAMNTGTPDTSELLLHSLPDPEVRISWKEMDDLDCCRYLSDEEDSAKGRIAASTSCSHP